MEEKVTATQRERQRLAELKNEVSSFIPSWQEIAEYSMPRKGRFLFGDPSKDVDGSKKHGKIINGAAADALRIIGAGMQGGLTSPSRPWLRLGLADKDLMEFGPVREYLDKVRDRMLLIFARSNFYPTTHGMYREMAAFGPACTFMEEDFTTALRMRPFTIGEYMVFLDARYRPAGFYRQFSMTAGQLVEKFGRDKVSEPVLSAFNNGNRGTRFEIVHCVEPNLEQKISKADHRGMSYVSKYFELNADPEKVLQVKGYRSIPFAAPRWDATGADPYGEAPGWDAIGDLKMLQKMEAEKLEALAKMNRPTMNAPASMKGKGGTLVPGGVNYIDPNAAQKSFEPAYLVNPDVQKLAFEIDRVEQRIRRYFFNDMFLAILNNERNMTATEVAKRYEEKMIVLGPVIERLQTEKLDIEVERTFAIMKELDLLPPPPKEIEGMDVNVQYISMLAQAQKMIGITAIEQAATFVGNLSQAFPGVTDKFDADEAVDQYAEMLGTPAKLIRSDDVVAKMREEAARKAQMAQAAQMAAQNAQTAKTMADTQMGQNSALDAMLNGAGGLMAAPN